MTKLKLWFYRFTAVHFCVTAVTGVLLYFRPLEEREGWYSEELKELLVGLHNGELWSQLLFENPYLSGLPIGLILAASLIFFSLRKQFRKGESDRVGPSDNRQSMQASDAPCLRD